MKHFKIISKEEDDENCFMKVEMDKRLTVKTLKLILKDHVKRGFYQFKVFKQFSSSQQIEMSCLNESFQGLSDNGKACLIVHHGRALKEKECQIKVFELDMNRENEYFKEYVEVIVEDNWTIEKTKAIIAKELKFSDDVQFRLRQKIWKTVRKIYFDDQTLKDLSIYNQSEVFCEKLMLRNERDQDQLSIYLRRFRSSIPKFDKFEEFYIEKVGEYEEPSFPHLLKQIKEKHNLNKIKFAEPRAQYPPYISVLEADELDWREQTESLSSYPFSVRDDGFIIFYR